MSFVKKIFSWQWWIEQGQKIALKLKNMKGSPSEIAAGTAMGTAITFTPFVGLHLVLAIVLAWIFKVNPMAAALGTILGNPWTFPFIWLAVLFTGKMMLGMEYDSSLQVDFVHFFSKAFKALMNFDFDLFFSDIWPILFPMIIGCLPYFIVVWLLTYFFVKKILEGARISKTETTVE